MVGVTTVALLERKPGMSRDLFTRYWRDVHGVMAARIPGFESYTQHHITPLSSDHEPFEGIAIVTFASEDDRQGLASSAMTGHIHRDEANVFRRALLYNLASDAATCPRDGIGRARLFLVLPRPVQTSEVVAALDGVGATSITQWDLTSGDPAAWNDTDVADGGSGRSFVTLIEAGFADADGAAAAVQPARSAGALVFAVDETHAMVERGKPTPVGLRGLDAVRTIHEAAATNQLTPEVERALYGDLGTTTGRERHEA